MTKQSLLPVLLILAGILYACDSGNQSTETATSSLDERKQLIAGDWEAVWSTDPSSYEGLDSATRYTMNGRFEFGHDGQVTVHTYGYTHCVFAADTHAHTSYWTLTDDYLYLGDEPGPKGISYKVAVINKDQIKLKLLNDTDLTLYQANAHKRGKKGKK